MSVAIKKLVGVAQAKGLKHSRGGWSKADVYWFSEPMPDDVRELGESSADLEYHNRPAEPWTAAHEFFFDPRAKVAIAFETGK